MILDSPLFKWIVSGPTYDNQESTFYPSGWCSRLDIHMWPSYPHIVVKGLNASSYLEIRITKTKHPPDGFYDKI